MSFWETALIGAGLSADAFSVAVAKGLGMKRIRWGTALILALFFGAFQALMPAAGYFLGTRFSFFVEKYAPWISFIMLAFIGGKMIFDAIRSREEEGSGEVNFKELIILSVATSLDALATGIVFAAEGLLPLEMLFRVLLIGAITFSLSLLGVWVGNCVGSRFNKPAAIAGGAVLIGIGLKLLIQSFL